MSVCVHRKQCIELEQQFDFLKDLVATVPDMQGEGEENHTEGGGEKVLRRYWSLIFLKSLISKNNNHFCKNAAVAFGTTF